MYIQLHLTFPHRDKSEKCTWPLGSSKSGRVHWYRLETTCCHQVAWAGPHRWSHLSRMNLATAHAIPSSTGASILSSLPNRLGSIIDVTLCQCGRLLACWKSNPSTRDSRSHVN